MKILPYFEREKGLIAASAFLMISGSAVNLLTPWPVKFIVDNVLGGQPFAGLTIPEAHRAAFIALAAFINLLCIFSRGHFNTLAHAKTSLLAEKLGLRVGKDLFAKVQALPLSFHDQARTGDLCLRLTDDVTRLKEALTEGFSLCVVEALTFLGISVILFAVDWRFAILALTALLPLFWVFGHFPQRIQDRGKLVREGESDKAAIVHEVLSSLRLVKSYAREHREKNRFVRRGHRNLAEQADLAALEGRFIFVVEVFTAFGASLVIGYGGWRVLQHSLSLGAMLIFLQYLTILYTPVGRLSRFAAVIQKALASLARLSELMAQASEKSGRLSLPRGNRASRIEFADVTFGYEPSRRVLDSFNLAVAPRERIAILGKTGEGKSSLLHLLLRFYQPSSGTIRIDDIDVDDLDLRALRRRISLLSQEPTLLRGTLYQNIIYGCGNVSREEVIAASEAAYAHDFISRLPEGYETMVGERGVSLSGGERQRVAIARALLKNAPILLMDEPTSAIDDRSEEHILDALERLFENKTVIFITHRKSLLRLATRTVVLKGGKLDRDLSVAEVNTAGARSE